MCQFGFLVFRMSIYLGGFVVLFVCLFVFWLLLVQLRFGGIHRKYKVNSGSILTHGPDLNVHDCREDKLINIGPSIVIYISQ